VLNAVSPSTVAPPVAPEYGVIWASATEPMVRRPLPPSTVNVIGTRSTEMTSPMRAAKSAIAPPSCPVNTLRSAAY